MNKSISLNSLRSCLEGVIPSMIATVAADGTPNITPVSQVHYVDDEHVALSFQFFNKTRENILANPHVMVQVVDPDTSAHYRLSLQYLRTETEGALFENMKARLAGIASHTGMSKVFRLLGADIYRVQDIEGAQCERLTCALPQQNRLSALRKSLHELATIHDLDVLFDQVLSCLQTYFDIQHSMLLMYDASGERLYTVASRGYDISGIGAEIPLGEGVIGVSAQQQTPIRILYMTGQYSYNLSVRNNLQQNNPGLEFETEIPFAGLSQPHSQLAVPIVYQQHLLGVLYVDSDQDLRFTWEDEDALMSLAGMLGVCIHTLQLGLDAGSEFKLQKSKRPTSPGPAVVIRHYAANDSIFIDEEYLIKGVAGAIFWKLLRDYSSQQRTEFNNRELRLDPALRLPDIGDNLEARLILLQKRLAERCDFLRMLKTGRGRFQLQVDRAITLQES